MRVIEEFEARSAAGGPEVAMVTMMGLLAGLFLMFAVPAYLGWRQHRIIRYEIEQYVDDVQDWNRAHPNHRDESWKVPLPRALPTVALVRADGRTLCSTGGS